MTDHQRQLAAMKAGMKERHIKLLHLYNEAGVSEASISRWLSGAHEPQPATWARLCAAYERITGETL